MDTVNDMTDTALTKGKEAGSSFVDMVRRHPLPTALIGAGVALLAAGGGIGASRTRDEDGYSGYSGDYGGVGYGGRYGYGEGDYGGYVRPGYGSEAATGNLGEPYTQGSGASRSFESYGAYDSGYDTGSYRPAGSDAGAGQSFGSRAGEVGGQAKSGAQDAGRGLASFIEEQPLVAGLITVVLGALIGLALPGTRQEDKLMGETRDQLAEQAREVAERAREVAQKTFDDAKETAKQEFSKVQEDVKTEGQRLIDEGKEAAKNVAKSAQQTAKDETDKQS